MNNKKEVLQAVEEERGCFVVRVEAIVNVASPLPSAAACVCSLFTGTMKGPGQVQGSPVVHASTQLSRAVLNTAASTCLHHLMKQKNVSYERVYRRFT